MALSGQTEVLVKNLEDQMERLLQQLSDLEEFRSSMSDEEFNEMKQDTHDQIAEFRESLDEFKDGDVTVMDNLSRMRTALQAAVSNAFKTPEVIRLFAKNQPSLLRERLDNIQQQTKLGQLKSDVAADQMGEILMALKDLGEKLSSEEETLLNSYRLGFGGFQKTDNKIGDSVLGEIKSSLKHN